jgi:hypothetical protein
MAFPRTKRLLKWVLDLQSTPMAIRITRDYPVLRRATLNVFDHSVSKVSGFHASNTSIGSLFLPTKDHQHLIDPWRPSSSSVSRARFVTTGAILARNFGRGVKKIMAQLQWWTRLPPLGGHVGGHCYGQVLLSPLIDQQDLVKLYAL